MRRSALFNGLVGMALLPMAACAQPWLTQEGALWVRTFHETAAAKPRLRINAHGPVTLEGNVAPTFEITVKVSVRARTREQARLVLERAALRTESQNDWLVLTTPGRNTISSVVMRAPRLQEAVVSSSDGAVEAYGIDGPLTVDTGADQVKVDRIHGDCVLATGGGDIHAGTVDGFLHCITGAGAIAAKSVRGEAVLRTNGGDINVLAVGGGARVETGGGTLHLGVVNGAVTAINGGGPIIVDTASGIVTTRNMAGPVRVGAAAGIRCDSANGGIQLGKITGPMRVSTSMGSIVANLLGSQPAESYLATANGDITVIIPSNLGIRIVAENQMADSIRRILSDFREIQPRLRGMHVEAEGAVNGGGPLLQLSASSGTIFLRRQ
jgi:DUF4097 and DUF4098 domain-containing protein YvlB